MSRNPLLDTTAGLRAEEVHPKIAEHLSGEADDEREPFHKMTIDEIRTMDEENGLSQDLDIPVENVENETISGPDKEIPIRIYDPRTDRSKKVPVIMYLHGGGWISGSIETHNRICRKLATEFEYPVISVGYRLAPEHPFPEGLEDCYTVLEWIVESNNRLGIDSEQIIVMGDSAGGNLAASTVLLARDRDGPDISHQVLIYPAVGDARTTQAYSENETGYALTANIIDVIYDHYTESDIDDANYYAWPRKANDLSDLPPATIITAGFDPLRDDGILYAKRLKEADVPVSLTNYPNTIHGFFAMIGEPVDIDVAHDAYDEIVNKVSRWVE